MVKTKDIHWLAGLLEGEGCFWARHGKYPSLEVGMTDEDIIVRVANMWNVRVTRQKNVYRTQINGAIAVGWMMTLHSLLGDRRRSKINSIIKYWKKYVNYRAPKGTRTRATCHPDRVVDGFGLCRPCYMKEYRKRKQLLKVI